MSSPPKIRVLCVDDHGVVREGLTMLLTLQPDMEVVGCAGTGAQAIELYKLCRPDITLMDLRLPLMSGLQALGEIRHDDPDANVIVLTTYGGDEDVRRAMELGASAYLLKDTVSSELIRTIRDVHSGNYLLPDAIARRIAGAAERTVLTERELEIVRLLADGLRNKEIADALAIQQETVHAHMKHIFSKLGVHDRTGALSAALRRGIIELH